MKRTKLLSDELAQLVPEQASAIEQKVIELRQTESSLRDELQQLTSEVGKSEVRSEQVFDTAIALAAAEVEKVKAEIATMAAALPGQTDVAMPHAEQELRTSLMAKREELAARSAHVEAITAQTAAKEAAEVTLMSAQLHERRTLAAAQHGKEEEFTRMLQASDAADELDKRMQPVRNEAELLRATQGEALAAAEQVLAKKQLRAQQLSEQRAQAAAALEQAVQELEHTECIKRVLRARTDIKISPSTLSKVVATLEDPVIEIAPGTTSPPLDTTPNWTEPEPAVVDEDDEDAPAQDEAQASVTPPEQDVPPPEDAPTDAAREPAKAPEPAEEPERSAAPAEDEEPESPPPRTPGTPASPAPGTPGELTSSGKADKAMAQMKQDALDLAMNVSRHANPGSEDAALAEETMLLKIKEVADSEAEKMRRDAEHAADAAKTVAEQMASRVKVMEDAHKEAQRAKQDAVLVTAKIGKQWKKGKHGGKEQQLATEAANEQEKRVLSTSVKADEKMQEMLDAHKIAEQMAATAEAEMQKAQEAKKVAEADGAAADQQEHAAAMQREAEKMLEKAAAAQADVQRLMEEAQHQVRLTSEIARCASGHTCLSRDTCRVIRDAFCAPHLRWPSPRSRPNSSSTPRLARPPRGWMIGRRNRIRNCSSNRAPGAVSSRCERTASRTT
jgi:hypothetical protein